MGKVYLQTIPSILKNFLVVFIFGLLSTSILAQGKSKHTLSGYVRDKETGETLIGATVTVKELPGTGSVTNSYGFYSLTLEDGKYNLSVQFLGYETYILPFDLKENKTLDFVIAPQATLLKEATVTGERKDENITRVQMGVEKIDAREIENIPVLLGERDVLKTIQLRPGVKSAGEGNSGFYVRGGTTDQNLILLDEATVYNASHLLGFFSVFNTDAIKDVSLYKGTQPPNYGGRLASVLDIKMKEGNEKQFVAEGGVGLISSRLKIDGPIVKDKGSFTISGRRTYLDQFLKLATDTLLKKAKLYFYDSNIKANYKLNEKNRIFLSGYFGKDVLGLGDNFGFDWGNATGTLRWNHVFGPKMFSNTSLIYSNYNYNIRIDFGTIKAKIISRIQDFNFKEDFQLFSNTKNEFKFGINSVYHLIIPGAITVESDNTISELKLTNDHSWENAAYLMHTFKPNRVLNFEYGLRVSSFTVMGPGNFYNYDAEGETKDTLVLKSGDFGKTYVNPEPRAGVNYIINERNAVKLHYGRNAQNLHQLSNSTSGNPTDLWVPSSNNIKPQISDQISFGYFRNFLDNSLEFSTEVYYKFMQNQIDYKDGAELNFNEKVENQLLYGDGRAYGLELFLKKKYGKLTGWIGYTLSRSERKIAGINSGKYYPAKQDRLHDVSIVGMYELGKKLTVAVTWVYYTGNAVTFPSGKYAVDGQVLSYYTERNGYRMPDYHRLDVGVTWLRKQTEHFESSWNFSVYNAYGRKNAYSITFRENADDPTRTEAVRTTLFRWIPSATYNFKF